MIVGVVSSDGTFTAHEYQPKTLGQTLPISPDGTRFASGEELRRTADGSFLAQVPDRYLAVAWFDVGIILAGIGGMDDAIWDPDARGTEPQPMIGPKATDASTGVALTPAGQFAESADGCAQVYRYAADMREPIDRFCGIERVFALSDSGRVALVDEWTALDVETGDRTRLAVPRMFGDLHDNDQYSRSFYWEDDDNVVMDIKVTTAGETVLVRCTISAHECERASDELPGFDRFIGFSRLE